jgi:hypothetical protein
MARVSITTAIKYGFVVVAYFIGILIIGGIVTGIGFAIVGVGGSGLGGTGGISGIGGGILALIGIIIGIIGYIIILGAAFGIQYKIFADGVERGIQSAGGMTSGRSADSND